MVTNTPCIVHVYSPNGCDNQDSVQVSSPTPTMSDNEFASGSVVFLHRDTHPCMGSSIYNEYFSTRRRCWEMRWQGRLKRAPSGELFFGAEVRGPLPEFSYLFRAAAFCLLGFARQLSSLRGVNIECNFGDAPDPFDGHYMLFPFHAADVLIESEIGSVLPDITSAVDLANSKRPEKISCDYIYTLCFYSMYADLLNWRVSRVPGLSGFCLSSFAGRQPVHAVIREKPCNFVTVRYYADVCFHHERVCPIGDQFSEPNTPGGFRSAVSSTEYQRRRHLPKCFLNCWIGLRRFWNSHS